MATRNIVLTNHQSEVVDQLIASGRYQNASKFLRAGLRMIEEAESSYVTRLNALKEAVEEGVADVEHDRVKAFTADEFSQYLQERVQHFKSDDF
jgi:antitoxin ParD1/3/4